MSRLDSVLEKKTGFGFAESGSPKEIADRAMEVAENLAEVEAGGLHFAGLRLDVSPMRADHH